MNQLIADSEFVDAITVRRTAPDALLPLVASNLRFAINGRALVDVGELDIQPGAPSVIMGPNGAGKSLLLRLLHGLIAPTAGTVTWDGKPANEYVGSAQAMVFQRPVLLRRSVAANVDYALKVHGVPRNERSACVDAWLEKADLAALARQPARTLSGGEQQRLALARALAVQPQILFLDEPTASLDPVSTQAIETLIRDASSRGTKMIMVTHDLGQAKRLAGEIIFMHRGEIAEKTPAATFFDTPASEQAKAFLSGGLLI
ncbi:MAG: ATP-binding cassette domain-containing protein [Rhodobiaceae bacterium]|nr:ATP-binding cassette domain-containing protein [Rhodobiaceae bacterium]MCC0048446.1 ATP-binding cassette domain-containing protein [Rhodobiaceae bacterium]